MPARFKLQPLPAYAHAYLHRVARSMAPSLDAHLDNAALVTILSDSQQRFYDRLFTRAYDIEQRSLGAVSSPASHVPPHLVQALKGLPKLETVNADLQVQYVSMAHKYDELRVEVGVDPASISRVAFSLRFRVTLHRTAEELQQEEHLTPIVDALQRGNSSDARGMEGDPRLVALAEIGVVRLNLGRPCDLGGLKQALEEVIADQDRLLARMEKKGELGRPGGDIGKGKERQQKKKEQKQAPPSARL
ncbi:hypothetical protein HDU96_009472 [Phlyctochytrium bullatum]|nr:hypothetical protein HDU96_009472 [Phlyctochytrium bullatum]